MALPGVFCSIVCRFLDERCREAKTMERKSNSISRHYRIWLLIFPKFCTVTAILIEDFHWKKINKVSAVSRPVLFFLLFFLNKCLHIFGTFKFWNIVEIVFRLSWRHHLFVLVFLFEWQRWPLGVKTTHTHKKKQKNDDFFHKLVELEEDSFFASRGFAYDETTR